MFIFTGAAGLVASCLGACAMTACCTGTKELMRRSARLAYCLLFVLAMITAWLLRDFAQPLLEKIPWIVRPDVSDAWYGKQAVYRVSLGNFTFFAALALALLGVKYRSDKRDVYLHHGGWIIKLLLWLLFNALPFLAPVPLVGGYAWLSRLGGGAFLVLQMLILLDFTQTLNDSWVEADDERYLYILLAATLGCYAGIVGTAAFLLYVFNTAGHSCSLNVFLVVSSLLLVVAFSVVSLHPAAKNGSLFPSAVIGMYCMYLTYSALASEPHNYECNGLYTGDKGISAGNESTLVLSMLGTLGAVVWSALRAGSNTALFSTSTPTAAALVEQPLIETGSDSGVRSNAGDEEAATSEKAMDEFEPVSYNYSFFHFIFSLASMYLAMLLTGWGVGVEEQDVIDVGWASVWVKVGALWLIGLMYVWTLIAPAIFPDREF